MTSAGDRAPGAPAMDATPVSAPDPRVPAQPATMAAGFWRRAAAAALDGLILSVGGVMVGGLFGGAAAGALAMQGTDDEQLLAVVLGGILLVTQTIGNWLYYALFESSSKRATPGKMALRLTVTGTRGEALSFGTASGRFFGKLLSVPTLGFGFAMAGITRREQALHDLLADALVVRVAGEDEAVDAPYPGTGQAVGLLGTLLLLTTIVATPFGIVGAIQETALHEHPAVLAVVNLIAFSLVIRAGLLRAGGSFVEVFSPQPPPAALLVPAALTILGATVLLSQVDNLFRWLLPAPEWIAELLMKLVASQESAFGSFLALVVVAPVTEELLFRGLILRGLLRRTTPAKAVWISALLFGAFHLNPWQFLGALAVGLILGWWYAHTGSVSLCVLGHALFNGVPFVLLSLLSSEIPGYTSDPLGPVEFQPLWLDAIGVGALAAGLLWTRQRLRPAAGSGD